LKLRVLSAVLYFILVSFSDPYSIKRISDQNYRYEFYTTSKTIKPKPDKTYFWFKGGQIHNAQYGMTGELLDGKFLKVFLNNQLAEQGEFKKGLKKGIWKTWYSNGIIETTENWSNGLKSGLFEKFDDKGNLITRGRYTNGMKYGKWIDFLKKDTLVYNRDVIVLRKQEIQDKKQNIQENDSENLPASSIKKESFFKRIFGKNK
jgi:antitoxin component YwqK of YwqJK toxin-antitoxin module